MITWHPILKSRPHPWEGVSELRVPLPGDRYPIPVCTHYIRHLGTTMHMTTLFTYAYTGVPPVPPTSDYSNTIATVTALLVLEVECTEVSKLYCYKLHRLGERPSPILPFNHPLA